MAVFFLTSGNDTFAGTTDHDFFQDTRPGGSDALEGGLGTDTFFAQVRNAHMVVDLEFDSGAQLSLASDPNAWVPGAPSLSMYNFVDIENIEVANSDGLTILRGDSQDNYLFIESGGGFLGGGAGNDRLSTLGGDVDFDGGSGNDTFEASFELETGAISVRGGDGFDTFRTYTDTYGFSLNNLVVSRIDGGLLLTGGHAPITLYDDVEELRVNELFTFGPPAPDTVLSYAALEAMVATPVPKITGNNTPNILRGTEAAEIYRGLGGNDTLVASLGADTLDGGAGFDLVQFEAAGNQTRDGVTALPVDLSQDPYLMVYRVGGFSGGEAQRLFGIEAVQGTTGNDQFRGTIGKDFQQGLIGDDLFYTSPGADTYWGGGGARDRLGVRSTEDGSVTQLSLLAGRGWTGEAAGDRYDSIEWVLGFGPSPFDIAGDHGSNLLRGGVGNDTLSGLGGNDLIDGGAGEDTAVFKYLYRDARVEDRLFEGSFSVDPALNAKFVTYTGSGRPDGQDKIANIETLQFLDGALDLDTMVFTPQAVQIDGTGGADQLTGTDAQDLMRGFSGKDVFFASAGADKIDGGGLVDLLIAGMADEDVYLSLLAGRGWVGDVAGDRFVSIENATTGAGNDTVTGDYGANAILTGNGDDVVTGLGSGDVIDTGAGYDRVIFTRDRDQYDITSRDSSTDTSGISWLVRYREPGNNEVTVVTHAEVLQFADGDFVL